MFKKKSKAQIFVADGTGGMSQVEDRRFEQGDWPIQLEVPREFANRWLTYLSAECRTRGWSNSALKQLDHRENSGTVVVRGADAAELLTVVWERRRDGPLKLKARSTLDEMKALITTVDERCRSRATERFYRRGLLRYEGLPWQGEFWLTDTIRLSAPSEQDQSALIGPRYIIVDTETDAVDWSDAATRVDVLLRELAVFLTVVLRKNVSMPGSGRDWTWTAIPDGSVTYEVRNIGYGERNNPAAMPSRGETKPVPLLPVSRPDFSIGGITSSDRELSVPDDIVELWRRFEHLSSERRREFLQAGTLYQLGYVLFANFRTASFAYMVAACEALKPAGRDFRDHNAYNIVEALLGKGIADQLRGDRIRPQDVRSVHFHRGEFRGNEFVPREFMSSFDDPSFDQSIRELFRVAQATIVEWLRNKGVIQLAPLRRQRRMRRWVKTNAVFLVPVAFILGAVAALIASSAK